MAHKVLSHSPHCFLCGSGANSFAESQGIDKVPEESLVTPWAVKALEEARQGNDGRMANEIGHQEMGTVGAVAVDAMGNVAAATSTGGLTNKAAGRIGDTPVIGAGVYASNSEGRGAILLTTV